MTNNRAVTDFITSLCWSDIPPEVAHQTKRCLLDCLGALLAGYRTPVVELMIALAREQMAGNQATLLLSGEKLSNVGAALVNGFACNALDIDDGLRDIKGHAGTCTLPVLLSLCESYPHTRGEDFLVGFLLGYEIGIRAGLIRHATENTYRSSGSWGTYAGVAAAARIMKLSATKLQHAMGAAEYYAPLAPMMKCIEFPSMGKDSTGWACMAAMCAVQMAERDFTCIPPVFDDTPEQAWITSLGDRWRIMDQYFKPYAGCRWAQPAIDGALQIMRENSLPVESIAQIEVFTFAEAAALPTFYPDNTEEAQYNFSFPIAAALVDGEVGPRQVLERIFAPEIRAVMDKIKIIAEARFQSNFPKQAQSEVLITTVEGKKHSSGTVAARWDAHLSPPGDNELEDKFRWLVAPILGTARAEKLVNTLWGFEKLDSLANFMSLCVR